MKIDLLIEKREESRLKAVLFSMHSIAIETYDKFVEIWSVCDLHLVQELWNKLRYFCIIKIVLVRISSATTADAGMPKGSR